VVYRSLTDCLLLLTTAPEPLSAARVRRDLEKRGLAIWSLISVKRSLAKLKRWGLLGNRRKAPRGYYLPENLPPRPLPRPSLPGGPTRCTPGGVSWGRGSPQWRQFIGWSFRGQMRIAAPIVATEEGHGPERTPQDTQVSASAISNASTRHSRVHQPQPPPRLECSCGRSGGKWCVRAELLGSDAPSTIFASRPNHLLAPFASDQVDQPFFTVRVRVEDDPRRVQSV